MADQIADPATDSAPESTPAPDLVATNANGEADRSGAGGASQAPGRHGLLLALSLLWLATNLANARARTSGRAWDESLAAASLLLPQIIAATMIASAAVAIFTATKLVRLRLVGLWSGAATGIVVAGALAAGYGTSRAVAPISATLVVAALIGGYLGSQAPLIAAAWVRGSIAVAAVWVGLSRLVEPIASNFGGSPGRTAQMATILHVGVYLLAFAQGAVAAVVAVRYLGKRAPAWPWLLAAGAAPGLGQLLSLGLARIGGRQLRATVAGLSQLDRAAQLLADSAWLTSAILITFVGGLGAMIAFGRRLSAKAPG